MIIQGSTFVILTFVISLKRVEEIDDGINNL